MKNHIIYNIVILAGLCVLASSCVKEGGEEYEPGIVYLQLAPVIDANPDLIPDDGAVTKGAMTGTSFDEYRWGQYETNGHTFGITINKAEKVGNSYVDTEEIYSDGFYNMFARYKYEYINSSYRWVWKYYLADGTTPHRIPMYSNRGNVFIYGYYPYRSPGEFKDGIADIRNVPFDVQEMRKVTQTQHSRIVDLMYMEPVTPVEMPITKAGPINQRVTFKHALSALHFNFTIAQRNLDYMKVDIETSDGEAWLPVKGYMDAMTGEIKDIEYDSEMTFYYYKYNTSDNLSFDTSVILPEIPYDPAEPDRELVITIHLGPSYASAMEVYGGPITLNLDRFTNGKTGDEKKLGLLTNYYYNVYIRIDNYVKIEYFELPEGQLWGTERIDIKI